METLAGVCASLSRGELLGAPPPHGATPECYHTPNTTALLIQPIGFPRVPTGLVN